MTRRMMPRKDDGNDSEEVKNLKVSRFLVGRTW